MNFSVRYSIQNQVLHLSGEKTVKFNYPIRKVEDFGDILVIQIEPPPGSTFNENIFGVSKEGKILWQIPKVPHVYKDSIYVEISKDNNLCVAHNWDGEIVWLDPKSGKIIKTMQGK